ncbi:MAG: ribbon-helix-helix domain-containing protein [Myxococcota bacterium]
MPTPPHLLKTERINIPVTRMDVARLDSLARREDTSRAQVVRRFLREGLEREFPGGRAVPHAPSRTPSDPSRRP